jgi:hypothetical protein
MGQKDVLSCGGGDWLWALVPEPTLFPAVGVLCADSPFYSLYHRCGLFVWKGLASAILNWQSTFFFYQLFSLSDIRPPPFVTVLHSSR